MRIDALFTKMGEYLQVIKQPSTRVSTQCWLKLRRWADTTSVLEHHVHMVGQLPSKPRRAAFKASRATAGHIYAPRAPYWPRVDWRGVNGPNGVASRLPRQTS